MQVRCTDLSVDFLNGATLVSALRGVSFDTRQGEFVSIAGPSGCGKTTLLRVLAGLVAPASGSVKLIPSPSEPEGRALMVFQERSLFPWMTVLENAAFGLEMQGIPPKEREQKALALLDRFGLGGRARAFPNQLSVGMKQRVALIRCFLSNPSLMLMDEPFAALDAQTKRVLQQELLTLWEPQHRSVIFVTHDIEEALLLSDRVLVLSSQPGTVVAEFIVPFERPRTPGTALTLEFLDLKRQVLERLGVRTEAPVHAS